MNDNSSRVIEIDINEILPNRFQPRIQFDEAEILELSDSIKEHGVIQPIVVRTIGDKYEIIAGERRYKASVLAGKETVPVIVKNLNDKDSAEVALIENVQRKNLTPIEEALSYKKILDMGYITQEKLAEKLGKSQSSVANKIRLLNLSDEVQEALLENKISERHARSLLKLDTSKMQNEMLNKIISERLTVRKTDEEIEKLKNSENIKEKEEINMNNDNNMFGMPNIPQNPQSTFDIFGSNPVSNPQPVETTPIQPVNMNITPEISNEVPLMQQSPVVENNPQQNINPTVEQPIMPSFDMFNFPSSPAVDNTPKVENAMPVMPEVQPTVSQGEINTYSQASTMPTPNYQFNTNDNLNPVPNVPEVPVQPMVEQPMPEVQSNPVEFQQPMFNPTMNITQEVPTMQQPVVPETAPIMESTSIATQTSEDLFSFKPEESITPVVAPEPVQQPVEQPTQEFKIPEPIIITDYNKQYDPIMPQTQENINPTVDFKEVINAIRECSNKIEQYGYKIDVEEYDLTNLYQVIFKIEK